MININDIEDLEKIMQLVDKFDFSHFELEQENSKIAIDKNRIFETKFNEHSTSETKMLNTKNQKNLKEEIQTSKEENVEKEYIKATFPGNFYFAKEKGEEAFVKLNDHVECDTVVGLIEAMKLFNDIEAGASGIIVDVLVEDGDFVEYGQPLFEIKSK